MRAPVMTFWLAGASRSCMPPTYSDVVSRRKWDDLDPRVRCAIVLGGAFEAGLKVAALIDLAQRPTPTVRGSKTLWATALVLGNSAGLLPIIYFLRGRRIVH